MIRQKHRSDFLRSVTQNQLVASGKVGKSRLSGTEVMNSTLRLLTRAPLDFL